MAALQSGETPDDEFLQHLLAEALAKQERGKLILQLQAALSGFDTAAIYTIHGFCLRVLGDYAFLCGVPFELETGPADTAARLVAAQDFWREHVADHPQNARIAARFGITPASVLAEFSGSLKRAFLDYRLPENRLPQILQGYNAAWQKLRQNFDEIEAVYCRILPQINKKTFNKTVGNLLNELKQLAAVEALPELQKPKEKSKNLLKFETEALRSSLNKAGYLSDADIATLQPLAVFGRYLAEISDAEQEADEVTPVVVGVVENTMPPSPKRAEGINGFRHHQNGKEIEKPVNVGYIVGDEVAGKGQHGCVDQHDKAGKPPQETLP